MYNYYRECERAERNFLTDLAEERRKADTDCDGIEYSKKNCRVGSWQRVKITSEEGERCILRPMGNYDTLTTKRLDLLDDDALLDTQEELARKLCEILDENGIIPARILVCGFGNPKLTPDSVGPKSATRVKPTLHISEYDESIFDQLQCSEIAVFCPSVPALCGMESSVGARAVCEKIMPDVVFAVDSIMTSSIERLGATFQISNTGLFPGGIGNLGSPITRATMGAPVISIGVPTVMDCRCIDKSAYENQRLFISPREIDDITNSAAFVIGGAINQAFGLDF